MYAVALPSALLQRYRAGLLAEHTDHGAPRCLISKF
jgi:hypothetical protein